MRLIQYLAGGTLHLAGLLGDSAVDLPGVRRLMYEREGFRGDRLAGLADRTCPADIADFLALGDAGRATADAVLTWVSTATGADQGELAAAGLLTPLPEVDLAPPMSPSSPVYCVGFNYAAHVAEAGAKLPEYPELFIRGYDSVTGHDRPIIRPAVSDKLDYEAELAVVIGRPCHRVSPDAALGAVAGYACFNDGSLRDYQKRAPIPTAGKNFASSGSMGPWLVTKDEVPDPQSLSITTQLNGDTVQSASTDDMIFDVRYLVSYISEFAVLQPGDVIATGTPSGVGFRRDPQRFMVPGDELTIEFGGVGLLRNRVIDEQAGLSAAARKGTT